MEFPPFALLRSPALRSELFAVLCSVHFLEVSAVADEDGFVSGWEVVVSSETVRLPFICYIGEGRLWSNDPAVERRREPTLIFYANEFSLECYTSCSDRRAVVEYCRRKFAKFLKEGV